MPARLIRHLFPVATFAVAMAGFYPGHLSFDSAVMFWQARTGEFHDVSPSLLPLLWRWIHAIWPGSGGVFALQVALFIGGAWLACCAIYAATWQRIVALLVVVAGTPAFLVVTHLWTDALMIAFLTAACGLILAGDRFGSRPLLFAALPWLMLGGMVRHNAAPALIPLLAWWMLVHQRIGRATHARPSRILVVALIGALGLTGLSRLLDAIVVKHPVFTFTAVQVFDLAGMSVRENVVLLPAFMLPPGYTLAKLRAKYVPYNNVPLFAAPDGLRQTLAERALDERELASLRNAWIGAILAHPVAYLSHRLEAASWLFGRYRNDRPRELAFMEEVDAFADNPRIRANDTPLHRWAIRAYERAIGWWGFAPVTWLAVAVGIAIGGYGARRTPDGQAMLAMAASGLAYVAPLVLVVPSAELRYSGWLFAATSLALLAAAPRFIARLRERRASTG